MKPVIKLLAMSALIATFNVQAMNIVTPMMESMQDNADLELTQAQTACLRAGGTNCVLPPGSRTARPVRPGDLNVTCVRDRGYMQCNDGQRTTTCIGDATYVSC